MLLELSRELAQVEASLFGVGPAAGLELQTSTLAIRVIGIIGEVLQDFEIKNIGLRV